MAKDLFMPVRRIHGRIHDCKIEKKKKYNLFKHLCFPPGKKVYLFGTPNHTNIGDSAIVIAEKYFLSFLNIKLGSIKELTVGEHKENIQFVSKIIHSKHVVFWHGGGNFGNQWIDEELFRRETYSLMKRNPTIIFPQTIYFTPDEKGEEEKEKSIAIYNNRDKLCIMAREQTSYEMMKSLYPDTEIFLTPDIVLSTSMETYGVKPQNREGVMLCMRSDAERSMTDENLNRITDFLKEKALQYYITDMHSEYKITKENRMKAVRNKMEEFAKSKLVITDRLHGMIFAAITETPCIVFSNYNHKVKGTYEWIKYLPYIEYVESVEEAKKYIPELLKMNNCKFDNKPLQPYFDKLAEVIQSHTKK